MCSFHFQSKLREGFVRPPNAMDGIPAPISRFTKSDDAKLAKEIVKKALYFDFAAETNDSTCHSAWIEDMTWYIQNLRLS